MAYEFVNAPIATGQIKDPNGVNQFSMSVKCVSGTASAPVIVDGFKGLLYIANRLAVYEPTNTVRVVTQNVNDDNGV